MLKRGNTVQFQYIPSKINPQRMCCGRAKIKKVFRERGTVLVSVWNGLIFKPVKDEYSDIEIPISDAFLCKK